MPALSEQDAREYFREKIKIVQALKNSWKKVSAAPPARVLDVLAEADALLKDLAAVDARMAGQFGKKAVEQNLDKKSDRANFAQTERAQLKTMLLEASDELACLKARIREMKDELGKRISDLRSDKRQPRHGRFDRRG